jgi:hypothetical protein
MLGRGAMVFWTDLAADADAGDFHEWHSKEHIAERVGISGFRRGYRYIRVGDEGDALIFMMYEVDDLATLTSAPYLDRLNDPTPWTRRCTSYYANNNRTLCAVTADVGIGIGGFVLTVQVAPDAARKDEARARLRDELFPRLVGTPGIVSASLLEGDDAASRTETEEKRIRGTPDRVADWVILVRGYDPDALRSARDREVSDPALGESGVSERQGVGLFRLMHCITDVDL